jgi:hypothetical protein
MEPITIKATNSTPEVSLDNVTGYMGISGTSRPENVFSFYNPIVDWLQEYTKDPNDTTVVSFNLLYFNSSTAQIIHKIVTLTDTLYKNGHQTEVLWYYAEDDEESLEAGQDYQSLVSIPFSFIKTKS